MRVLNQTARVAVRVHAYERVKLVRVTCVSSHAFTVELVAGLYRITPWHTLVLVAGSESLSYYFNSEVSSFC